MLYQINIILFFLSDFGFVILSQPLLYCQITSSIIFFSLFVQRKGMLNKDVLTIIVVLICSAVWSVLHNYGRSFAGQEIFSQIPITGASVLLTFIMIFALKKSMPYYNLRMHKLLFALHFIYFVFELISFYGFVNLDEFLKLFHAHPKALEKFSMSMFGKEHSYGSMGPLALILITAIARDRLGMSKFFYWLNIIFYITVIIQLTSKTALICATFFLIIHFISVKQLMNVRILFVLPIFSVLLIMVLQRLLLYVDDFILLNTGSTFLRFHFVLAGIYMFAEQPLLGTGLAGYRFNFVDTVLAYDFKLMFGLDKIIASDFTGGVDPTNFFVGVFAEFGAILGSCIFYLLFKCFRETIYSIKDRLMILCIFALALCGFYFWAQPFIALFATMPVVAAKTTISLTRAG